MLKTERQRSILAMCDRYGTITVKFIQEVLNVSDMTIRRDLEELAQKKKLYAFMAVHKNRLSGNVDFYRSK